jgi:hypothetical protein
MEKTIEEIVKELHRINFAEVIKPIGGGCDYDYLTWKRNAQGDCGGQHCYDESKECYCNICDNCSECADVKEKGIFTPVSHGTHMYDLLMAHSYSDSELAVKGDKTALGATFNGTFNTKLKEVGGWSQKPVLFVMENPAGGCYSDKVVNEKNVYKKFDDENHKNPTTSWYWLDGHYNEFDGDYSTDKFIANREYGRAVYSIMKIFHIANGYLTNMVKCGIGKNDQPKKFKTTDEYDYSIIKTCIKERLEKEIKVLSANYNDVIIFAFGERTYDCLNGYFKKKSYEIDDNGKIIKLQIECLPHPARCIKADERRKLIYEAVDKALKGKEFYGEYEPKDKFKYCFKQPNVKADKSVVIKHLEYILQDFNNDEKLQYQLKLKDGYDNTGAITYTTEDYVADNDSTQYIKTLTLRYKTRTGEKLHKNGVRYVWAQYDFMLDDIKLYVGYIDDEKKGANNWVANQDDCKTFDLYNILCKLKEVIK